MKYGTGGNPEAFGSAPVPEAPTPLERAFVYGEALAWIAGFAGELRDRHTGFVHIERRALAALGRDMEHLEGGDLMGDATRECPYCDGRGWNVIAVHDPTDPDGEPLPEQEQCATCGGSGRVEGNEG